MPFLASQFDKDVGLMAHSKSIWHAVAMAGLLGCVVSTAGGCASMMGREPETDLDLDSFRALGYDPTGTGLTGGMPIEASAPGVPAIVLEVRDNGRHLERIPLSDSKPMFVGDIVRDAKLVKRVGRIELTILRPTAPGSPPMRLEVGMNNKSEVVQEGQNYQLHPGDHIIVTQDSRSYLQQVAEKAGLAQWMKR